MKHWNVAAYIRLSKEDGDNIESNSITNQSEIAYILNERKILIPSEYKKKDKLNENLICNECGTALRKSQKYYYCNTYSRTRKCSKHSTNRAKLIAYVINDINKKVEKYKNLTELNRDIMFEIIDSIKICEDGRIIIKYKK